MKLKITAILFSTLLMIILSTPSSFAVTLTVGNGTGISGETIQIPIKVDNPVGIAAAAFTITFDANNLTLNDIQSGFFDTFANQWAALSPPLDLYLPASVVLDSTTYSQPLLKNLVDDAGMRIAAVRCNAEASDANKTLFILSFTLKAGASANTYPISVVSTTLKNINAGYDPQGKAVPMLVGLDISEEEIDPAAYLILIDPSAQPPVGSVVSGNVTFKIDSDGDGVTDDEDPFPDNPYYWLDTDGDKMPDAWEDTYGLSPLSNDANEDPDGDGFTNLVEYQRDTDPQDPESHPPRSLPWLILLLGDD